MAIAPFEQPNEEPVGGQRTLRLIPGGRPATAAPRRAAVHALPERDAELARSRAAHPTAIAAAPTTEEHPVEQRDLVVATRHQLVRARTQAAIRAQTLARRRRTAAVLTAVVAVALLALPVRALGAVTLSGQETPAAVTSGLSDGSTYVVQPGDTIRSIAVRINPATEASLEGEIAREVGSSTVVPGEHVRIP